MEDLQENLVPEVNALRYVKTIYDKMVLSVLPFAQGLMSDPTLTAAHHKSVNKILLNIMETQQHIIDITELLENDSVSLTNFALYNVEKYLTEHAKRISSLFDSKFLQITVKINGCKSDAVLDIRLVNLILAHLVSNAVMHSNMKTTYIIITASMRGDDLVIQVSNEGRKIPKKIVPTLFSAYKEITNPKRVKDFCTTFDDVKLGLAVCLKAAKKMGGDLVYMPSPNNTVFELTVPQTARANLLGEIVEYIPNMREIKEQLAGAILSTLSDSKE